MAKYAPNEVLLTQLKEEYARLELAVNPSALTIFRVDVDQLTADYKAFGWNDRAIGALMVASLLGQMALQSGDDHVARFMLNYAPVALARLIGEWGFPEVAE